MLIVIFTIATIAAIQEGSVPGAGVSFVILVASIFAFINTAFGIGPISIGQRLGTWLEPRLAAWLHDRLDPPSP